MVEGIRNIHIKGIGRYRTQRTNVEEIINEYFSKVEIKKETRKIHSHAIERRKRNSEDRIFGC